MTFEEDAAIMSRFINAGLNEVLRIRNPKGILPMARQVRLVVGEGPDKTEIGTADVDKLPNGDAMVILNITNAKVAAMLGGNKIQGVIPKFVDPIVDPEPTPPPEQTPDTEPVPPADEEENTNG